MARVQLLLCFTIFFSVVTLQDVVSAHLKIKPALPQIEDPKTIKDVEPYTVKVVMVFVSDLEKECPETNKFKVFFEKLRAYAKYVCPIQNKEQKDYDRDMKAKAGSLFQTIASFAVGKIKEELQEEKMEAINTFKWMKSLAGKIMGGRKKEESEESMKLTTEQQKEIREGILKWEMVIARIANTMVISTTNSSSSEDSTSEKGSSSGNNKRTGSESSSSKTGSSSKKSTGSSSNLASHSGSPLSSPSGSTSSESGTSFKDTTGGSLISPSGSSADSPSVSTSSESGTPNTRAKSISPATNSKNSASSENVGDSKNSAIKMIEVEAETSKQVMAFIMNLEKKCPQKEEYKGFFEKLKGTMTASLKVSSEKKKGFFSGIKSAAGKLSDSMVFMLSRIGSKSAEVKKSMETYQAEVMKAVQELETIHSQIVSQNQGKKDESLTVTSTQQKEIKQTITKWEQVTTQFVETAIQSETSSTSSSLGNIKPN